jgi:hypothetical protein
VTGEAEELEYEVLVAAAKSRQLTVPFVCRDAADSGAPHDGGCGSGGGRREQREGIDGLRPLVEADTKV